MSMLACERCGSSVMRVVIRGTYLLCSRCVDTEQAASKAPGVVADSIPGGFIQENFGDQPETFYSWSAMRQRADQLGLQPFVRQLEQIREGDYIDAQTLENAKILLSRRKESRPDPDPGRLETLELTVRAL